MPVEFGTVRVTVPPGYRSEDVEFPGPGLYEAVFDAPGWIVSDFDLVHDRVFTVGGHKVQPIWTRYNHTQKTLVFRLRIHSDPDTYQPDTQKNPTGSTLTVGNVIRGYGDLLSTWIAQHLFSVVFQSLREVRKIIEVPTAALLVGGAIILGAVV